MKAVMACAGVSFNEVKDREGSTAQNTEDDVGGAVRVKSICVCVLVGMFVGGDDSRLGSVSHTG